MDFSFGKKWMYHLKGGEKGKGLIDTLNEDEKMSSLIVCFVNNKNIRHFSAFDNFIECIQFMLKIPVNNRSFHEIVLEKRNQKMRFDIDVKKTEKTKDEDVKIFMDDLIESIIEVYGEFGYKIIPEKHILLFSSHGKEKWSYHIVIDGFYCETCQESLALFKKITGNMRSDRMNNKETINWLDSSIYSANHSLRILGSVKGGRQKVLEKCWRFKDKEIFFEYSQEPRNEKHRIVMEFERSFISLTENCFPIPNLVVKNDHIYENKTIDEEISDYAFRLFRSLYGDVFKYDKTIYNFVLLERDVASGCPICDRVHENENAFLIIKSLKSEIGKTRHEIFFCCRRSDGKKLLIGEKIEQDIQSDKKIVVENKTKGIFNLSDLERVAKTK